MLKIKFILILLNIKLNSLEKIQEEYSIKIDIVTNELEELKKQQENFTKKDFNNKKEELLREYSKINEEYYDELPNKKLIKEEFIQREKLNKYFNDYLFLSIYIYLSQEEKKEFLYENNLFNIEVGYIPIFFPESNFYFQVIFNDNLKLKEKIYKILLDKKIEFKEEYNLYSLKKNSINLKDKELYELHIIQFGLRNNKIGDCSLISLEIGLNVNLFKIKETNNNLLENYYLSLLKYNNFLEKLRKKVFSKEDFLILKKFFNIAIKEIIDNEFSTIVEIIINNSNYETNETIKNYEKNNNLYENNKIIYELIKEIIDNTRYILKEKFIENVDLTIWFFKALLISFNILENNNKSKYFMPLVEETKKVLKTTFSNNFTNIIPLNYSLDHLDNIFYSYKENEINKVSEFIENWENYMNSKYENYIKLHIVKNQY